jgi:hypothetical protein
MHYYFGRLVLFVAAVAVYLLSWCGFGACFCCLPSFVCCLGAVYCCYSLFLIVVLVMHSLGKLVQFTAAVAVYLLSCWCLLGVRFCCCCRSFAVLVMIYRISLVLSSAAASIYCWQSW